MWRPSASERVGRAVRCFTSPVHPAQSDSGGPRTLSIISFNPTAQILRAFLRPGRSKSATDAREQEGGWLVWVLVQYEMTLSGPLRQLAAAFLSFPCLREDQGSLPRAVPVPAHSTLSLVKKRNTDPVVRPDECHHSGHQQARPSSPPGIYMYLLLCLGMYLPPHFPRAAQGDMLLRLQSLGTGTERAGSGAVETPQDGLSCEV